MVHALISCLVTVNKYMHMTQVITLTLYKYILSKYIMLWLNFIKCGEFSNSWLHTVHLNVYIFYVYVRIFLNRILSLFVSFTGLENKNILSAGPVEMQQF